MKSTTTKRALAVLVVGAVAGLSYAAGAAKGKQAVNVPAGDIKWEPYGGGAPLQVAKLWGDRAKGGEYAMLLKLPAGFEAGSHSHTADYHAVTVQGNWVHTNDGDAAQREFPPGSYVMQPGKQLHNDICKGTEECILFIHQHGKGDFIPAKAAEKPAEKK
jgi:anti-sigma factor ChrR (cupin superfamily)